MVSKDYMYYMSVLLDLPEPAGARPAALPSAAQPQLLYFSSAGQARQQMRGRHLIVIALQAGPREQGEAAGGAQPRHRHSLYTEASETLKVLQKPKFWSASIGLNEAVSELIILL